MHSRCRGFTFVETVIATAILVTAAVAIASLFVSSIRTNIANRERSAAAIILSDKLEQLKASPLSSGLWSPGNHFENVSVPGGAVYRCFWQVSTTEPRTVTLTVSDQSMELVRATTIVSATW